MALNHRLESERMRRLAFQLLGAFVLGALWVVLTHYKIVRASFLPGPMAVWRALLRAWDLGLLQSDVTSTFRTILFSLALSTGIGIPVGTILGLVRSIRMSIQPLIWLMLTAPLVAFVSIFIIWFGFGSASAIALGFVAGAFNIMVTTSLGVAGVDRVLLNVARVFCRTRLEWFYKVILPASLAVIATGIKFAAGRVIVGVVVGEMFGSNSGLGARLVQSAGFFDIPTFYVSVFSLAIVASLIMWVVNSMEARMGRFKSV